MASTCDVYKHGVILGSGSCEAASATISTFTVASGARAVFRKNVQIVVTQAGTHAGRAWYPRVLADDGGGNLTLSEACPFTGA